MDRSRTVYVWDPLLRLFHWSLVIFYCIAWITGDDGQRLHEIAGYTVVGLILFRLIWGFTGPHHARFSDFVRPPGEVARYLADTVRFRARRHLGHNPAGGVMVLALLASLLLTAASGILLQGLEDGQAAASWSGREHDDELHEVDELIEEAHELLANLSLLLVGLHIMGVVLASLQHRENLVRAMITGRKPASTPR